MQLYPKESTQFINLFFGLLSFLLVSPSFGTPCFQSDSISDAQSQTSIEQRQKSEWQQVPFANIVKDPSLIRPDFPYEVEPVEGKKFRVIIPQAVYNKLFAASISSKSQVNSTDLENGRKVFLQAIYRGISQGHENVFGKIVPVLGINSGRYSDHRALERRLVIIRLRKSQTAKTIHLPRPIGVYVSELNLVIFKYVNWVLTGKDGETDRLLAKALSEIDQSVRLAYEIVERNAPHDP